MRLCNGQVNQSIDGELLSSALRQSYRWSSYKYGDECITCAEIYDVEKKSFTLHITSPGELLFNTSALLEFRKSDAKLLDSGVYHSCKVKRTKN